MQELAYGGKWYMCLSFRRNHRVGAIGINYYAIKQDNITQGGKNGVERKVRRLNRVPKELIN